MMPLLVVAIGQTFVLIVAGIDLAAPAILALASVVGASVMTGDGGYLGNSGAALPGGLIAFVLVGGGIGLLQRPLHHPLQHAALHRHPDDDDVLLRRALVHGVHTDDGSSYRQPAAQLRRDRQGDVHGVPDLGAGRRRGGLAAHLTLTRTVYGRWLYAVGTNARAAEISGVPVRRAVAVGLRHLRPLRRRSPRSSTPGGWRPARRCWASASCST
jgi:ribose/xylose/arabinose/galactoside ABC-type transport system permease subunit